MPRNFESFEEYRNSEWFACASTFSKYCTDCLCQIHSMRKVLDYEVPCCHGKCKGKIEIVSDWKIFYVNLDNLTLLDLWFYLYSIIGKAISFAHSGGEYANEDTEAT